MPCLLRTLPILLLPLLVLACSSDPVPPPVDLALPDTLGDSRVRTEWIRGDGGQSCDDIKAALAVQVELARICQPMASTKECTRLLKQDKLPCGCPIYINPANTEAVRAVDDLLSAWRRKSCGAKIECKTCATPSGGSCEATPPGSKVAGLCLTR